MRKQTTFILSTFNELAFLLLITKMNLIRRYMTLIKTNARRSITISNRYILTPEIFCKTEEENVIPPTNARTIEANIPKIEIYSFSTPLISS